jgi:hypothetical protein
MGAALAEESVCRLRRVQAREDLVSLAEIRASFEYSQGIAMRTERHSCRWRRSRFPAGAQVHSGAGFLRISATAATGSSRCGICRRSRDLRGCRRAQWVVAGRPAGPDCTANPQVARAANRALAWPRRHRPSGTPGRQLTAPSRRTKPSSAVQRDGSFLTGGTGPHSEQHRRGDFESCPNDCLATHAAVGCDDRRAHPHPLTASGMCLRRGADG